MSREAKTTIELSCPSCDGDRFELRVLGDEGLAAANCVSCARDFLVLDSEDYWFDAIQATYPRARRCSCKSKSLKLRCDYTYRSDGEVRFVALWSVCPSCEKTKRQMSIDVNYGGTEELVKRPLRFCETPNLRYDLKDISLYLTRADMTSIIGYLDAEHKCTFICWLRENNTWVKHRLRAPEVQQAILSGQYLCVYASLLERDLPELQNDSSKKEESFWKRHEVIRISSPTKMHMGQEQGLLYHIQYSNEYVEDHTVVQKQAAFRATTASLLQWLSASFVSWRGKYCFDSAPEHLRLFGDEFSKSKTPDRHSS